MINVYDDDVYGDRHHVPSSTPSPTLKPQPTPDHLMVQGREHTFGQKDRSRGDLFC